MAAGPSAPMRRVGCRGGGAVRVASKVALLVLGTILVLLLRQGCVLYEEAAAQACDQWNCVVSDLIPVREPHMPYWTPDWGTTWKEVDDE